MLVYEWVRRLKEILILETQFSWTKLPVTTKYKDLNQDAAVPCIKLPAVNAYLATFDRKHTTLSSALYMDGYINYIRVAKDYHGLCYFKAECRTQMKASVSYSVDVSVDAGWSVVESQCECAVEMGPTAHCKHVVAVSNQIEIKTL